MAKPRIFVSSTFYDLRHIRSALENFISDLGFEPVLSEKGDIAYNPDMPLDESCYKEASSSNIYVLIIGGRYGSVNSSDKGDIANPSFYDRYESITRKEYEAAVNRDIPIYILIDNSVYTEYDTYKSNRDNETIRYAHVDSVNIFHFIDKILNQPRNNPIQTFDKYEQIEDWLRDQWAGLFNDLLSKRSDRNRLKSLSQQVSSLADISDTLKTYLEVVVSKVSEENAAKIIKDEDKRLKDRKKIKEFEEDPSVKDLINRYGIPNDIVLEIYESSITIDDFANRLEKQSEELVAKDLIELWKSNKNVPEVLNKPRLILGLEPLNFETNK